MSVAAPPDRSCWRGWPMPTTGWSWSGPRRLHRSLVGHCLDALELVLQIVKRSDDQCGFVVLPKRWIVERTNAWLMRTRRLARDYERRPTSAEAMVTWSMTTLMIRRLTRPHPQPA